MLSSGKTCLQAVFLRRALSLARLARRGRFMVSSHIRAAVVLALTIFVASVGAQQQGDRSASPQGSPAQQQNGTAQQQNGDTQPAAGAGQNPLTFRGGI